MSLASETGIRGDKVHGTEAAIFENRKDVIAKRLSKYWAGKSWEKAVGIPPHLLPNPPTKQALLDNLSHGASKRMFRRAGN